MIELAGAWGSSFCIAGGMPGTLQLHIYTCGAFLSQIICAMSTRSFTKRAKVLARNPAPNRMLGMVQRGMVGSEGAPNCEGRGQDGGKW